MYGPHTDRLVMEEEMLLRDIFHGYFRVILFRHFARYLINVLSLNSSLLTGCSIQSLTMTLGSC